MAVVENRFVCDLAKPVQAQALKGNVFSLDNLGSRLSVLIYDNGQPATISGSITANCILPDGSTVNVNGSLTTENGGSKAYVDIPQSCLLISGILKIAIKCTSSSVITTLAAIVANVYMTKTDNVITPSQQIIDDWNAEISAAIASQDATIANQGQQISDLKSQLTNEISDLYDNRATVEMTDAYCISRGLTDPQSNNESSVTNFVPVHPGQKLRLRNVFLTGNMAINGYRANQTLNGTIAYGTSDTEVVITIPASVYYIRATGKNGETVDVVYIGLIDERFDNVEGNLSSTTERIDNEIRFTQENAYNHSDYASKNWQMVSLPQGFNMTSPVSIFTDGYHYTTDFNREKFMNQGGSTYYVSPNGTTSDSGGTREKPWLFSKAISSASAGDTIILLEGSYDRDQMPMNTLTKSLNIIGEGNVKLYAGNFPTFTSESGYSNVYKGTRNQGVKAFEISENGKLISALTLVNSVASVENTVGSYFRDNTVSPYAFYVHPYNQNNLEGRIFVCVSNASAENPLSVDNSSANVKAYFENIELIGHPRDVKVDKSSSSNTLDVCYNNIRFVYCGGTNYNALSVYGGNVVINKSKVCGSFRDGFNYNGTNSAGSTNRDTFVTEIDCEAYNCGLWQSEQTMNGSTAHKNAKVIRINGCYHDNLGANCADVQADTQSVNLGCIAFNSLATTNGYNQNFSAQQSGATMWCENCIGVSAYSDFNCASGASLTMNKCSYENKNGTGIVETNTVPVSLWMLRNKVTTFM